MTENLTEQYDGYAKYVPSLQMTYASYATKTKSEINRGSDRFPKKWRSEFLNFLDKNNGLWHCGYTLYSCGQFDKSQIRGRDIVAERNRSDCIVIGDSGGFQLGTGKITSKSELAHLERYKNDPVAQFQNWHRSGFRERTLKWLDLYADYSMTLDMVLWAVEDYSNPIAKSSQLRKLSVQQLIDLSVDNLKYFSENRGRVGKGTKFLSVLQDIGGGTGEMWYDAVKDFEFEGWALGSETGGWLNSMRWLRRLLIDKKLDKSEWIHTLAKSPPKNSVIYTAAQRALRKALGRDNFDISFDSSSPHQIAGKQRNMVTKRELTKDLNTWTINSFSVPQDIRLARNERTLEIMFESPLSNYITINDLMAHDIDDSDSFIDAFAEHLMVNHNIYAFHRTSIDACDLIFHPQKQNLARFPDELAEVVGLIEAYFEAESVAQIEDRMGELLAVVK